ncbi:hypothetical protein BgAZ_400360 [Babesia gibsoni]|uniref:U2A'/phosphoprotein 32 family A C-terminal domain-containing protein n=1 Tax=Babesia gibsoni TaxID=33632 RepID=A0AAD8PDD6_BABGI|nr:hypothetical protein BgAZ_400360 [Babesia gibsoni]
MDAAIQKYLREIREQHKLEEGDESAYSYLRELIVDGTPLKTLSSAEANLLSKLKHLAKLSMNGTGLTSLVNFPEIPSLKVLELTDNHLSDSVIFSIIPKLFPNICMLHLGGNHLKSLDDVKFLSQMKNLVILGLAMNPLASADNYREAVFAAIPSLQSLDQVDHTGVEHLEDSDAEYYEDDDVEEDDVLKRFYEADYNSDDDLNDDEFIPDDGQDEDEDFFEEDDDDEEDGDNEGDGTATSILKRPHAPSDDEQPFSKKQA